MQSFSNGELHEGDCKNILSQIKTNSVDQLCTDPPYGYAFMNKDWDKAIVSVDIWKECLRVLKPGAFAFVMAAPRQDVLSRMIVNLSNAGFKTDFTSMYWAYASGFPKAGNVSKIVDKKLKVKPEIEGIFKGMGKQNPKWNGLEGGRSQNFFKPEYEKVKATSKQSKKLDGSYLGFQPKPAVEVILVVMKPLSEKNYTAQAISNGKGITWLNDCRIPYESDDDKEKSKIGFTGKILDPKKDWNDNKIDRTDYIPTQGRFPANLLVSDDALNDGILRKSIKVSGYKHGLSSIKFNEGEMKCDDTIRGFNDSGSFSRYFDLDAWHESWDAQFIITPKASKSEKNKGLENLPTKQTIGGGGTYNVEAGGKFGSIKAPSKNHHPTVKPVKLFKYLITLGSRENDVVLDPFIGSGTTALACNELNRKWIGIEKNPEYIEICKARLSEVTLDIFN